MGNLWVPLLYNPEQSSRTLPARLVVQLTVLLRKVRPAALYEWETIMRQVGLQVGQQCFLPPQSRTLLAVAAAAQPCHATRPIHSFMRIMPALP